MTKAITKNSKKGFTLVELVIVIAILAILAAIAIPVVNSIINTASKNSALSNAETLELAIKNCQADIASRNNEVYNPSKTYIKKDGTSANRNDAAKSDSTGASGHQAITIEEVAGVNSIYDALEQVTYNNATFEPFWDKNTDSVVYVCTVATSEITAGTALTTEGTKAGYYTAGDTTKVQLAKEDTPEAVKIDSL